MNERIKISAMPEATSLTENDIFPMVQGGTTQHVKLSTIVAAAICNYVRILEGDEEIPYVAPAAITICAFDPNGFNRIVTPSADFPEGSIILMTNKGPNSVTFNDGGSPAFEVSLGSGDKEFFIFDGTNWG
jgi:hypothetical protein